MTVNSPPETATSAASKISAARLLPWARPDGAPCYLSTDGVGPVSELADRVEEMQLTVAEELLMRARHMLHGSRTPDIQFRFLAARLAESLHDALRVAASRGERLPDHEYRDPVARVAAARDTP